MYTTTICNWKSSSRYDFNYYCVIFYLAKSFGGFETVLCNDFNATTFKCDLI